MDTVLLDAFVEIVRQRSFSRAAHALHVSQPAISKRMSVLETQIGAPLFDRVGRTVELTEAGRALLPHAERVLQGLANGRHAVSCLSSRVAGPLSLATSHHIGLHRLPTALRAFVANYPQVELNLQFMDSESACQRVAQGRTEIAVVTLPLEPVPQLERRTVWQDPMRVVAAADHPLAVDTAVDASALNRFPAILPGTGTFTRCLIQDRLTAAGVIPRVLLETNYLETIRMLVGVGLAWSVLPLSMLENGLVPLMADRGLTFERRLGVVSHRQRRLSGAAQAFLALLPDGGQRRKPA